MLKKNYHGLLFIVLASVILNLLSSPPVESFFDDKEIFKYAGFVIYKGGVPYRDFFDHKPPLIYFFNALYWISGSWSVWLLDTLLILIATILFYQLCRKNKLSRPWFLPVIFNLIIRYSLISFGNGMTREYTSVLLLIFFCVMQGSARHKHFILGLLVSLTFWMQQDAVITLLPFILYSLFSDRNILPRTDSRIFFMGFGFVAISLPVILYFQIHHALNYLWRDAFLFNMNVPGSHIGFFEKIKSVKHAIHVAELELPFYITVILGISALFLKNRKPVLLYAALITVLLSFSGEWLTGRLSANISFIYYLLPLSACIPILLYVVLIYTPVSFLQEKTAQLIFCLMISITLFLGTLRFASTLRISSNHEAWFAGLPEIDYLKTQSLKDYELYVFDDSNGIFLYNDHQILAPSPWIYQYIWSWSLDWDKDNKIFKSILVDLENHKTRFILDCSEARKEIKNVSVHDEWQKFLQTHYTIIIKDSSNRKLWRIQ